jgi:hypothetical protein
MSTETKLGEGADEQLDGDSEKRSEEELDGRATKDAADATDKEKLGEAAGAVKKAVHSFIHDDKKLAKNQPYRDTGLPEPKANK